MALENYDNNSSKHVLKVEDECRGWPLSSKVEDNDQVNVERDRTSGKFGNDFGQGYKEGRTLHTGLWDNKKLL